MAGGWSMRWTPHGTAYCLAYDEHTPTLIVRDGDTVTFSILPRSMDEVTPAELAGAESLHAALGEFVAACHAWTDTTPTTATTSPAPAVSVAATAGGAA